MTNNITLIDSNNKGDSGILKSDFECELLKYSDQLYRENATDVELCEILDIIEEYLRSMKREKQNETKTRQLMYKCLMDHVKKEHSNNKKIIFFEPFRN